MTMSPRDLLQAFLSDDEHDEAVSDTAPGPAPLAGLWEGELDHDLADPVMRWIRFDQFLREVVSLGSDIAVRMGQAAIEYTAGNEEMRGPQLGPVDSDDDFGEE